MTDDVTRFQVGGLSLVEAPSAGHTITVALAGQPNVGKTTLFNLLTGLNQHIGNWPGKTVEQKVGIYRHGETVVQLVDLPGTYSLTANSVEEQVARDYILHERPAVVVMVANAATLERNLYLLAELLALPTPVVVAVNMMDVAAQQGIRVEPHVLAAALGLPVVPMVASRNQGVRELMDAVLAVARQPEGWHPVRPHMGKAVQQRLDALQSALAGHVPPPWPTDWVALKLLEGDAEITRAVRENAPETVSQQVDALLLDSEDAILDIASARYEWIGRMVRAAVVQPKGGQVILTDRLDRLAAHPLWGLFILLGLFGATFWLTFTVATPVQAWLDVVVVGGLSGQLAGALAGAPVWLAGLLTDGVLGGAGTVVTFLPVLVMFYAVLGLLEDTGYLARAGYVMDRFMHPMGLHGKSFLPLFLGFGCNVPAVMGTRVIESARGRLLTLLLAPLVPCAARLTVVAFLAPALFGPYAALVSWGLVSLNLLVLAALGVLLNRLLFRGERVAFIMELPLYHTPNLRTISLFVGNNALSFLKQAGTLILAASVMIWVLGAVPGPGLANSLLADIGRLLLPLGQLMGMDWRMLIALVSSFVAKENAIATLGILYGMGEEAVGLATVIAHAVSPATGLAFLVVSMLFIPCLATVATVRQESRSWRWTLLGVALLLVVSLAMGIGVYQLATWPGV